MAATIKNYTLTARDKICLLWIALQYAIRFDHLQRLLYRHSPETDQHKLKPGTTMLSVDRTYDVINKWLALGLVEKKVILNKDGAWIWLTRAGLREIERNFNFNGAPASGNLSHLYAINAVRLAIEEKRPGDIWKSEREIRKEMSVGTGESQPHPPDAILTNVTNGKVTALEIEVHSKTDDQLENTLRELAVSYKSVWYFCTRTTRRQVETMLDARFEPTTRKPFVLYDLLEYTGGAYGLQ